MLTNIALGFGALFMVLVFATFTVLVLSALCGQFDKFRRR